MTDQTPIPPATREPLLYGVVDVLRADRVAGWVIDRTDPARNATVEIRREGMMFACDMASDERVAKVVEKLLEYGVISFWFLSHPYSFRLSPPLNITEEQIHEVGKLIQQAVHETNDQ